MTLLHRNMMVAGALAALVLSGCATGPSVDAEAAIRQVDGDVAVLAVFVRGDDLEPSLAVASQVRRQVVDHFGVRVRDTAAIRAAIAAQLEGAALRPSDRLRILDAARAVDADPQLSLEILREHRAATMVDRELRRKARSLFLRASTEALARGDAPHARELLTELHNWLSYTVPPPGDLEVPRAVRDLWEQVAQGAKDTTLYRHTLPFLSLLPHGHDQLALATTEANGLAPDVVEEAARLGTALRLDKVILAGMVEGHARAYVVDVSTRACIRTWTLSQSAKRPPRSAHSE
ncbi:MAG: hypothetical protein EP329_00880 [Deltaproteobacteria bacterium]|nr:MAG: hypothetical protein EP329_00880 [Deltaproteobacteria bacterium]